MQKNLNIEKIIFKVVQMKFLAMHITNQNLSFDIFTVGNLQNIFMEHDLNILMIFGIKEKCIILTQTMYCCLLLQIYLCYLWLLLCSRVTCVQSCDVSVVVMAGILCKISKKMFSKKRKGKIIFFVIENQHSDICRMQILFKFFCIQF